MIKIFKKFVYEGEFLEIDLKNQINQYKYTHLIFFFSFYKKNFKKYL